MVVRYAIIVHLNDNSRITLFRKQVSNDFLAIMILGSNFAILVFNCC